MPAGAEAVRAERAARRAAAAADPTLGPALADTTSGRAVIRSAWIGTTAFAVATVLAVVVPAARIPAVVVDLALFFGGSGLFLVGLVVAARRSRDSDVTLWNLILLDDIAPPAVRARLLGALGVQVVLAAATCWVTAALAFGWLVPMWGVAHCECWGARHGVFRPRRAPRSGPAAASKP